MGSKGERHLSRLAAPKTWKIKRKGIKFVTRPKPGMHSLKLCMPLNIILKSIFSDIKTNKEIRYVLNCEEVFVDGKRRKDPSFSVGFMDVLSIPKLKKNYRILIDKKGRLTSIEIDEKEAKMKLAKIKNKTLANGKIQLNLSDGRNILAEKSESKVGDTLVFEIPSQKVINTLKFEKGAVVYLFAGKHSGQIGKIEDIKENKLIFKNNTGRTIETLKDYAFVIGKEKPLIKIIENEH